ncbi:hypothetical protein [Falsiroseomonas sp. E2-1-a4]|uniref:hypothetical protein n=1 Tax=Falsiroseomonas sp. E2-1-a4 TaxID=3239299 RepID=UPI003F351BF8
MATKSLTRQDYGGRMARTIAHLGRPGTQYGAGGAGAFSPFRLYRDWLPQSGAEPADQ